MSKKTICVLTDYMINGGLERVVCEGLDDLLDAYNISIYALYGGVCPEIAERYAGKIQIYNGYRKPYERFLHMVPFVGGYFISRTIKKKYDILIILRDRFLMVSNSRIADKTVFWSHGDKDIVYAEPGKLPFIRRLNRFRLMVGYQECDAVWVLNDMIREKIGKAFALNNISVLPNPVDIPSIEAMSETSIDSRVFQKGKVNFCIVSRLSEEKGILRLLSATAKLRTFYDFRLVIIGDGPLRESLEHFVEEKGLEDTVVFVGNQTNPYPYIRHADVLVSSSYYESFGMTMLEALALKTPLLATDTTGGRFLTDSGKYGLLVENSEQGILKGMRDYLENKDLLTQYTDSAYQWAKSFDRSVFIKKLQDYLMSL